MGAADFGADKPVPGIQTVALVPRPPKFIECPLPPRDRLAPDLEKFTLTPLQIFTDFLNLIPISVSPRVMSYMIL